MALKAYVDDSGRGDPQVFVMAGYVSTAESWAAFSDDWAAVLRAQPKIDYFKANEAAGCYGQFYQWTDKARDAKVLSIVEVIRKHAKFCVKSVIHVDAYKEIFKGKVSKLSDNPFFDGYLTVTAAVLRYQVSTGIRESVDFIFDTAAESEIEAMLRVQKVFKPLAKQEWRPLIGGTPIFGDDKELLPLQAADLIAWHTRRVNSSDASNGYVRSLTAALSFVPSQSDIWDRARLERMAANLTEHKERIGIEFPYDQAKYPRKKVRDEEWDKELVSRLGRLLGTK